MTENSAITCAQDRTDSTHFDRQHSLEWVEKTFGLEPRWTAEPCIASIEILSRQHLQLPADARCSVKSFTQGGFNKLYKIETDIDTYLMRLALPVDPHLKTASEVATMEYVGEHTNIALPSIKACDSTNQNVVGFEWILMDFGPSHTLKSLWRSLTMLEKHGLIESLAAYQAELFDCSLQEIGNIYRTSSSRAKQSSSFELGPMVAMTFFWGDRGRRQIPRGPFRNSFHWLDARLHLTRAEQSRILEVADDEDVIEDAEMSKSLAEQLHRILPRIFDRNDGPERSIIFHDDLSMHNILVDNHKLPFIIDWECVSALPLWRACQIPDILIGRIRTEEPKMEDYGTEDIYWEHLLEYERWQLRSTFEAKMEELRPQWMEEYRKGTLKRDFEQAVHNCDNAFALKRIQKWLDAYNNEEQVSLEKLLHE